MRPMKPSLLFEGFTTQELHDELAARGAPQPWRYKAMIDWLQESAPLVLWRGTKADGTPVFDIIETDSDGNSLEVILGTGTDLPSAIHDARNPEVET